MGWHAPPEDLTLSNPLWHLALDLWERPGFAAACLEAQGEGIAVTHMLVALYQAQYGADWSGDEPEAIRRWRQESTQRLRGLRQSLPKGNPAVASLRQNVAECELQSEQVELAWWWHHLDTRARPHACSDLQPAERARLNLGSIGLDGRLASIRDRLIGAWEQTPEQEQPTGNTE